MPNLIEIKTKIIIIILHILCNLVSILPMKDTARKIIASILSLGWLATIGLSLQQWMTIVQSHLVQHSMYIITAVLVIFLAFFLQFGITIIPGKRLKMKWVLAWLTVILMWHYFFANNIENRVFVWDILLVIGVLMVYLTLAWLIVTKWAEKAIEKSKQTIIEV